MNNNLTAIVEAVRRVQNTQKSLRWGSSLLAEDKVLFSVGHSSYPKEYRFFVISDDFTLFTFDGNTMIEYNHAVDLKDCIDHCVISVLKLWFPPVKVVK